MQTLYSHRQVSGYWCLLHALRGWAWDTEAQDRDENEALTSRDQDNFLWRQDRDISRPSQDQDVETEITTVTACQR